MITQNIKNLLVDFGGVLINLNRQRCIEHFRQLGLTDIDSMLAECYKQDFFQKYEEGLITSTEFRNCIRQRINAEVTDEQIDEAWNSFLETIPAKKLELLLELRKRYRIFLLSNTNEIHWIWSCKHVFRYKEFDLADYFERIYLSFEMKLAKPDTEIFRQVIADSGIKPAETLFIDDSSANCESAASLGISTYTPKMHEDWGTIFRS